MGEFITNKQEIQQFLLTTSDITEILKNALGDQQKFHLLHYELKPEIHSVGYLGEYYNLNLEYKIENEKCSQKMHLFMKTLPYKNEGISNHMKENGIMQKEADLYINLLNELQAFSNRVWCAKCYFVRSDLIVLENVKNMGYISAEDPAKFFTKEKMQSLLSSLATMHASSIAYEVKNNISIGEKFQNILFETTVLPGNCWFEAGNKAVLELALKHPKYQLPGFQHFLQHELPNQLSLIFDIMKPSSKYRNVFCHRDLWAGNIFFKKPTENAIFVDFQLARYLPPAIDILMALYLGLQPSQRKKNMTDFCLFYYQQFDEALKVQSLKIDDYISLQEFKTSIEDLSLFGALYNCLCATALRLPQNFANNMKVKNPNEFEEFMSVERTKTILMLMEDDVNYKDYVNECIEDLIEFILLKKDY